jgi:hypothetical protein
MGKSIDLSANGVHGAAPTPSEAMFVDRENHSWALSNKAAQQADEADRPSAGSLSARR